MPIVNFSPNGLRRCGSGRVCRFCSLHTEAFTHQSRVQDKEPAAPYRLALKNCIMFAMLKRIIVGAILIALAVGVLWLDWWMEQARLPRFGTGDGGNIVLLGLPLAGLIALLVAAGYLELSRLAAGTGMPALRFSGMVCAIMVATLPFWRQSLTDNPCWRELMQITLGAAVIILFADQIIRYRTDGAIRRIGTSLLAICYLGVCGAVVLGIRMQFGMKAFILFLLAVKCTDIGAYFTGSAIGRHKIIPWLSPGKSWEGLVGGLVFSAVAAVGFIAVTDYLAGGADAAGRIGLFAAAGFAVVVGLFGQAADMCESALKRDAGLKDSGSSVPAFGGILDVVDSPLLAAPAAYVMLAMLL